MRERDVGLIIVQYKRHENFMNMNKLSEFHKVENKVPKCREREREMDREADRMSKHK